MATESQITLNDRLFLYSLVSPYRGPPEKRDAIPRGPCPPKSLQTHKLRRNFLDGLCYLCDNRRKGGTVTAAALRQVSARSATLWLAANEDISYEVRKYMEFFRAAIGELEPRNRHRVERDLIDGALRLAKERMDSYRERMIHFSNRCLKEMESSASNDSKVRQLQSWVRKLASKDHRELARTCYNARKNQIAELLSLTTLPGGCYAYLTHYIRCLGHYLGRLGAHVHAVKTILISALNIPILKRITSIQYEKPPAIERFRHQGSSAYDTLRKLCISNGLQPAEMEERLIGFNRLDIKNKMVISTCYAAKFSIPTRVHCELQLADLFSRKDWRFADGDKYIGCSKPACYFCAQYLEHHHHGFIVPATHNRVIKGVRGPKPDTRRDVYGRGAKKIWTLEQKMKKQLDRDILEALKKQGPRIFFQYSSTNGTSRASSPASDATPSPVIPN
ncbi:hypothetical protein F4780DRAFT_495166 [Xylariomycetidae sp. FL0641]|nr:hypothetical protein F4780DRAFT_495166 [Xylariomycetidae sp. FL0641]